MMITKPVLLAGLSLALCAGPVLADKAAGVLREPTASFSAGKGADGVPLDAAFNFGAASKTVVSNGLQFQILSSAPGIDLSQLRFDGVPGGLDGSVAVPQISVFVIGPLAPRPAAAPAYTLEVWGTATTGVEYGASLNVSMVPEPQTLALMLAGLGFMVVRSRRRSD